MKNTNSHAIADVLSKVAKAIRQLDKSEIETLLTGEFSVELVLRKRDHRRNTNSSDLDMETQSVISEIAELLGKLDDRAQGRTLLEQRAPTKEWLTHLVRHLDLPLHKRETVKQLQEKVIEATIGFRLRSRAIRGTDSFEKSAN